MKVRERGQITIPKEIRDRYGLHKDTEIELVPDGNRVYIEKRTRGKHPLERIYGIIELKYAETVDEYIEEIRGR